MFQTKVVQKTKAPFYVQLGIFENRAVYETVQKYCRAGQATDDNTAHAHCMLDT
jgi:hypothetical protein